MDATVDVPVEVLQIIADKDTQAKTERFEIRMSPGQLTMLKYLADLYQIPPAELIRRRVFDPQFFAQALTRRDWDLLGDYCGYRMAVNDLKSQVLELRREVARVGNNVNQIAKGVNKKKPLEMATAADMRKAMRELTTEMQALEEQTERLLVSYESLSPVEG